MTTRFSLAELASMLGTTVDAVRSAVDALADSGELTAESFSFGDRNWRIAPADTKRVKDWIEQSVASGQLVVRGPRRKVVKKTIVRSPESPEQ